MHPQNLRLTGATLPGGGGENPASRRVPTAAWRSGGGGIPRVTDFDFLLPQRIVQSPPPGQGGERGGLEGFKEVTGSRCGQRRLEGEKGGVQRLRLGESDLANGREVSGPRESTPMF